MPVHTGFKGQSLVQTQAFHPWRPLSSPLFREHGWRLPSHRLQLRPCPVKGELLGCFLSHPDESRGWGPLTAETRSRRSLERRPAPPTVTLAPMVGASPAFQALIRLSQLWVQTVAPLSLLCDPGQMAGVLRASGMSGDRLSRDSAMGNGSDCSRGECLMNGAVSSRLVEVEIRQGWGGGKGSEAELALSGLGRVCSPPPRLPFLFPKSTSSGRFVGRLTLTGSCE